jgi:hypothetical protein
MQGKNGGFSSNISKSTCLPSKLLFHPLFMAKIFYQGLNLPTQVALISPDLPDEFLSTVQPQFSLYLPNYTRVSKFFRCIILFSNTKNPEMIDNFTPLTDYTGMGPRLNGVIDESNHSEII